MMQDPLPQAAQLEDPGEQTVAKTLSDFAVARDERLLFDHLWFVCWQWYGGNSSVHFDMSTEADGSPVFFSKRTLSRRGRRARPINWIAPTTDLVVAKQMRSRPVPDVRPASIAQESDRLAARAGRDLLRHLWLQNELTSRRRTLNLDRVVSGNSFIKVFWDPLRAPFADDIRPCEGCGGQGQSLDPTMAPVLQMAQQAGIPIPPEQVQMHMQPCQQCGGQGKINAGRKPLGDARACTVSPWHIWPLAGSTEITDGCFHAYKMTKENASATFGIEMDELKTAAQMREGESLFAQLARQWRNFDDDGEDKVWVVEKWMPPLPGSECPRVTMIVGKTLVYPTKDMPERAAGAGPTKEPFGRIPIFHFRMRLPPSERFWAQGIVLEMISANDFINKARDNFHRHMLTMAYVKWLVERSTVDKDALTNEVGEVVEYTGINPPTQRSPAPMPEFYLRLMEKEQENIPLLANLQDVDRGRAPPNIEAYQALYFLAEQSETVNGPISLEDEETWRGVHEALLICATKRYQPGQERVTRIAGPASKLEVEALLRDNVQDRMAVVCEISSALSQSPALRQEQVFKAVQLGLIPPQRALRLLEWGSVLGEDASDGRAQESAAAAENNAIISSSATPPPMMMPGQPVQIPGHQILASVDDHEVHLQCHRRAAVEQRILGNLQAATALDQAAQQHLQLLQPPAPAAAPSGSSSALDTPGGQPGYNGGIQGAAAS